MTVWSISLMAYAVSSLLRDLRSLSMAEPRPLDLKTIVAFPCCVSDLTSNVFSLEVAIGPDDKSTRVSCLLFNILGNQFLVLRDPSV